MKYLRLPTFSNAESCPYIPEKECTHEYFLAMDFDEIELNKFLSKGWRKFGIYYFRPSCKNCIECLPIRVLVNKFVLSKSKKRVLQTGNDISIHFNRLRYSDDIYNIYRDHSLNRFNFETDRDEFIFNFYYQSCPSFQSEYYLNDKLIAVGFLDKTTDALSSVYFIYRTEYSHYSLGTYSILKEIEYSKKLKLKYYYLGYYIKGNTSMTYKNRFIPYELYDWNQQEWIRNIE